MPELSMTSNGYVCSSKALSGWGEKSVTTTPGKHSGNSDYYFTKETLRQRLKKLFKDHDDCCEYSFNSQMNNNVVRLATFVTVTTNLQPKTNELLKEIGWTCVGPFSKEKHPDSVLYHWIIDAKTLVKWSGYVPRHGKELLEGITCAD